MQTAAEGFVLLLTAYAAVGLAFALVFVTRGIQKVDHVAKDTGIGFRLIVLPGVVALWPLLLKRWVS